MKKTEVQIWFCVLTKVTQVEVESGYEFDSLPSEPGPLISKYERSKSGVIHLVSLRGHVMQLMHGKQETPVKEHISEGREQDGER